MTDPSNWEEAIDAQLQSVFRIGFELGDKDVNEHGVKFKQAITQAVKEHVIGEPLSATECNQLTMSEKTGRYMSDGSRLTIDIQNQRLNAGDR